MRKQHRHKLIPTPKPSRMSFCTGLLHYLFKFASRKNLEQLIQDAAKSFHGADSSSLITKLGRFVDRIQRISPFSVPLPKPNLDSSALKRRGMGPLFGTNPIASCGTLLDYAAYFTAS